MSPIILGVVFLIFGAGILAFFAMAGQKGDVKSSLAAIDAAAGLKNKQGESLFKRLMDDRQQNDMARKLQEAGWYDVTPQKMLTRSIVGLVAGAVFGLLILMFLRNGFGYFALVLFAGAGLYYPRLGLNRAIEDRKRQIHCTLPDFLDMLSTTVEAGVGLNGALITASDGLEGALGKELQIALQDIRLGRSRADALTAMANRVHETDLSTTVTAIVQSERVGASITSVLDQLAAEARERRLMRAEEIAGQLPNKLIFPMALCMLPALFIIIFGSVAAKLVSHQ